MPKYIIERDIPGAGRLTQAELQGISQKSCGVLREMGPRIQWLHSYVTGDKVYCIYIFMVPTLRRGNQVSDALASKTAKRFRMRSHAEHGNDNPLPPGSIF